MSEKSLNKLFDRWRQISFDVTKHPELTKGKSPEILLERPERVAPVKLPLIEYYGGKIRYGMHTDMIQTLFYSLLRMNEKVKNSLYIQGRIPNRKQWDKLESHPVYEFFLRGRLWRSDHEEQVEAYSKMKNPSKTKLSIFLPKGKVTREQAKNYSKMEYTPDTKLDGLEDLKTAWFKVDFLCKLYGIETDSPNAFIPLFGGFNGFSVGSNELVPGLITKASLYLVREFEDNVVESILASPLSQQAREQFDSYILEDE